MNKETTREFQVKPSNLKNFIIYLDLHNHFGSLFILFKFNNSLPTTINMF
jgi:hypothetical protein